MKSLTAELAISKIWVNVNADSLTYTPHVASLLNTEDKKEASAKRHTLQRIGSTDDMAQLVSFLLSDNSTWIKGQVIGVDGGMGSLKT